MMHDQAISDNEIYLLIKYIKSVLWRVAKCLSYIEEARCLKVNIMLVGRQSRCGRFIEQNKLFPLPGIEPRFSNVQPIT